MTERPHLSIVIPAFNEMARIPSTLEQLQAGLFDYPHTWEVIVSDDGSSDSTLAIVRGAATRLNHAGSLKALACSVNLGKGAAVRRGCLAARGERVVFTDADLAVPLEDILMVAATLDDADVAVGTRRRPGGGDERESQPQARRLMGRAFSAVQRVLAPVPQLDTQCPVKAFRPEAARAIFGSSRVSGWAFDVEVLRLAQQHGLRVAEVPVHWRHREGSRLRPGALTAARVFLDLLRIRMRTR